MSNEVEFKPWGKTPRYDGLTISVTEKIDGTNACVIIQNGEVVGAQSRNRLIYPGNDNMGFAHWVETNKDSLKTLGDGYHYGEWAGPGIQKNPHNFSEKRFLLFNPYMAPESIPECVSVVPLLYEGPYQDESHINSLMDELVLKGKEEGYTPEGVIVYIHQTRSSLKYTFNSNQSKWKLNE